MRDTKRHLWRLRSESVRSVIRAGRRLLEIDQLVNGAPDPAPKAIRNVLYLLDKIDLAYDVAVDIRKKYRVSVL